MRVVYGGPSQAVEVPDLGAVVERGVPTEVPDSLGARLVEQACWTEPDPKPAAKAARTGKEAD